MQQLNLFGGADPVLSAGTVRQKMIGTLVSTLKNRPAPDPNLPLIVSYGGGTNSTALLIAMRLKGIRPSEIVFSDTGNEHPETYRFIERFERWLTSPWNGYSPFPGITTVRYQLQKPGKRHSACPPYQPLGTSSRLELIALSAYLFEVGLRSSYEYTSLGESCLTLKSMPSKAYGFGACSAKWKAQVIESYVKGKYGRARQLVGIHAGEQRRLLQTNGHAKPLENEWFVYEYPLIEWGLEQEDCNLLCARVLGEVPKKSSCWFCPNASVAEVRALKENYPDYYQLGCLIEQQAMDNSKRRGVDSGSVKGLGRKFSWRAIDQLMPLEQLAIDARKENQSCRCMD